MRVVAQNEWISPLIYLAQFTTAIISQYTEGEDNPVIHPPAPTTNRNRDDDGIVLKVKRRRRKLTENWWLARGESRQISWLRVGGVVGESRGQHYPKNELSIRFSYFLRPPAVVKTLLLALLSPSFGWDLRFLEVRRWWKERDNQGSRGTMKWGHQNRYSNERYPCDM